MKYKILENDAYVSSQKYVKDTIKDRSVSFDFHTPSHLDKTRKYSYNPQSKSHSLTQSRFGYENGCANGFCRGVVASGAYITSCNNCLQLPKGLAPPKFYENETASYYEKESRPIYRK